MFPKFVYKRGTAKPVNDKSEDAFVAESALVHSEAELKALEGEWCDSPTEATKTAEKPKGK